MYIAFAAENGGWTVPVNMGDSGELTGTGIHPLRHPGRQLLLLHQRQVRMPDIPGWTPAIIDQLRSEAQTTHSTEES